jgi:hypothetical protein
VVNEILVFLECGSFHVYPGTLAASTWSSDVFDPGWLSFCVMDPRCFLCDLFSFFSEHKRHFGI